MNHFVFWADSVPTAWHHSYWVHDDATCLLAARLEGHTLFRHTDGDNLNATCKLCGRPFRTEGPVNVLP